MRIKYYKSLLALLIIGPVPTAILYGIVANAASPDDPSGIEYIVTILTIMFVVPFMLTVGVIVTLLTRKSEQRQFYSLLGFGAISVPTILFLLLGMVFA